MDWTRSSFCAADYPQCVEARVGSDGNIEVRDSKLGDDSPVLRFTPQEWDVFVSGIWNGDFDHLRRTPELV